MKLSILTTRLSILIKQKKNLKKTLRTFFGFPQRISLLNLITYKMDLEVRESNPVVIVGCKCLLEFFGFV